MQNLVLWKKWVEALRSGKYSQCKNVFSDSSGHHCAVGVLLDVAELDSVPVPFVYVAVTGLLEESSYADFLNEVAAMNNAGATFDDCADYIEQYLAKKLAQEVISEAKNKRARASSNVKTEEAYIVSHS